MENRLQTRLESVTTILENYRREQGWSQAQLGRVLGKAKAQEIDLETFQKPNDDYYGHKEECKNDDDVPSNIALFVLTER